MREKKFDLWERLIDYAVGIIKLTDELPPTKAGNHICGQLLRSGTSPAPNYSEALSAESKADFVHKLKIAMKELRESKTWLRIIINAELINPRCKVESVLKETDELIAILFSSVETTRKSMAATAPKSKPED